MGPQEVIREYYPAAKNIRNITSGIDNDVYIVDDEVVFRFPRKAELRMQLLFEADLLRELEGKTTLTVPRVILTAEDGGFGIVTFVKGRTLARSEIMAFSEQAKRDLTDAIVGFIREMNAAVTKERYAELRGAVPLFDDNAYYEDILEIAERTKTPYAELYTLWLDRYKNVRPEVLKQPTFVVHNDIHSENLLFTNTNKLAGVLDFGDSRVESVYQELRYLYRMGDDVVQYTIEAMNGDFGSYDTEIVKILAVTHELSVIIRQDGREKTQAEMDRTRASKELLTQWLGNDWKESKSEGLLMHSGNNDKTFTKREVQL